MIVEKGRRRRGRKGSGGVGIRGKTRKKDKKGGWTRFLLAANFRKWLLLSDILLNSIIQRERGPLGVLGDILFLWLWT